MKFLHSKRSQIARYQGMPEPWMVLSGFHSIISYEIESSQAKLIDDLFCHL